MELKDRCRRFLSELGVPVTRFCKNIELSTSSYHDWQRGRYGLSQNTLNRIERYLEKYGF